MANEKRLIDANELLREVDRYFFWSADEVRSFIVHVSTTVKAVPLGDIYRVIAGHSNYHGDNILSALTCIAEGKEVQPVKPLPTVDAVEVVHGHWEEWWPGDCALIMTCEEMLYRCSACDAKYSDIENKRYCPWCGANMMGGDWNG